MEGVERNPTRKTNFRSRQGKNGTWTDTEDGAQKQKGPGLTHGTSQAALPAKSCCHMAWPPRPGPALPR